jgi:hypothetical protein
MAAKTEWVNGNMADVTRGPDWKLLIHIRPFDRAQNKQTKTPTTALRVLSSHPGALACL